VGKDFEDDQHKGAEYAFPLHSLTLNVSVKAFYEFLVLSRVLLCPKERKETFGTTFSVSSV
jgi:hypothetical protein